MINKKTAELLKMARGSERKRKKIKPFSYLESMGEESRAITVRAAARKAIRSNKEAIELLADL